MNEWVCRIGGNDPTGEDRGTRRTCPRATVWRKFHTDWPIGGNYTHEPRQGLTLAIFYQNTWCHSRRQSTSLPPQWEPHLPRFQHCSPVLREPAKKQHTFSDLLLLSIISTWRSSLQVCSNSDIPQICSDVCIILLVSNALHFSSVHIAIQPPDLE